MKSVCLLVHGTGKVVDPGDQQIAARFRDHGVDVQWVNWETSDVYFHRFDAVLLRTCYGYHHKLRGFLRWLERAHKAGAKLINDITTVRWNSDKRYLRELQSLGVPTVPTLWVEPGEQPQLGALLAPHGWKEAVVKPVVSAGAENTWRVTAADVAQHQPQFAALCAERGMMVQPFVSEVLTEGELSLIYINSQLSHCVRKVPQSGDFRVQPVFGSAISDVDAPAQAREAAEGCFRALTTLPLYARVDGVMTAHGFQLMEYEVIEPSLYLNGRTAAIEAYVAAVLARL